MSSVIELQTITLPFLDDEAAALMLADRKIYMPVYKVCQALGIRADMHIRHWKNLALWVTARKLPFRSERQGKRQCGVCLSPTCRYCLAYLIGNLSRPNGVFN